MEDEKKEQVCNYFDLQIGGVETAPCCRWVATIGANKADPEDCRLCCFWRTAAKILLVSLRDSYDQDRV